MGKTPAKLSKVEIDTFVAAQEGWKAEGDALERTYTFDHYGAAIAFAVHVGFAADKREHHPDLQISWGKVAVRWTTHDAGGVTDLDLEMAQLGDHVYRR
jgi:4a-hydroxytetrahydrobiopterin dehydratase